MRAPDAVRQAMFCSSTPRLCRSWPVVQVFLGRHDAANVLAEKRGIGIAEHRRCGAVGDANLAVEIDDDDAPFHRRQNLARRVFGRELDEAVAADRVRGDGDEGEDGDESERRDVDADGRAGSRSSPAWRSRIRPRASGRASVPSLRSIAPRARACGWRWRTCRRKSRPRRCCRSIRSGSSPS